MVAPISGPIDLFEWELTYHGCSPCVLLAIQEVFNLENDRVFKASVG